MHPQKLARRAFCSQPSWILCIKIISDQSVLQCGMRFIYPWATRRSLGLFKRGRFHRRQAGTESGGVYEVWSASRPG